MKLTLNVIFGIPQVILGHRETTRLSTAQRALLEEAVEGVVDGIEPKMRLVRGYQKKLQPAVATARAYIDALVERIPGPLFITPKAFVKDPYVNAFFATAKMEVKYRRATPTHTPLVASGWVERAARGGDILQSVHHARLAEHRLEIQLRFGVARAGFAFDDLSGAFVVGVGHDPLEVEVIARVQSFRGVLHELVVLLGQLRAMSLFHLFVQLLGFQELGDLRKI